MAKIDLGAINSCITYSGNVIDGTNVIATLPSGEWVCVPVYPLNLDIVCAPDKNNNLKVVSNGYTGAVIVSCYNII